MPLQRQFLNESLKILGRFAVNGDWLAGARMNKLKAGRMKSNSSDEPLRRFREVVFSVTDHRVADRGELHSNLILQPRYQSDPDE